MESMKSRVTRGSRVRVGLGTLAALLATFMVASTASAQLAEPHFDVLLYQDGSGNLRAGAIDVDTSAPDLGVVAIEGELFGDTTLGTPTFQGEAPGFFSLADINAGSLGGSNDNLPGGAAVTLDFLVEPTLNISLAYWDDGLGQFGATPAGEALALSQGAVTFGSLGGTSEVVAAGIGTTGATGFLDDHPDYDLGAATPGVYLAYGQANVAGVNGPSNPFWIVFGTLDVCEETASCSATQEMFNEMIEEQIEAGIDYVNTTLVPEPGTALLMGLGLLGLGRTRRARP